MCRVAEGEEDYLAIERTPAARILYVDDDAAPYPGKGTAANPFKTIQRAIHYAAGGDTIVVAEGIYHENLCVHGKRVRMASRDPNDGEAIANTVIDGRGQGPVITLVDSDSIIEGFTITGGRAQSGGGVHLIGSEAEVRHCIISLNEAQASGGGICGESGRVVVVQCTLAGNVAAVEGGGISGEAVVSSSILWGNAAPAHPQLGPAAVPEFCCIQEWTGGGQGNIGFDPLFADPFSGDWHLCSQAGRWDPAAGAWVYDEVTSPCIDAGDWADGSWSREPWPHGDRVNMGAYGGTSRASLSRRTIGGGADFNGDGRVDYEDFRRFCDQWARGGPMLPESLDGAGAVDLSDLTLFSEHWLESERVAASWVQAVLAGATDHLMATAVSLGGRRIYPMRTIQGCGAWVSTDPSGWTSGFFPGCLWQAYRFSRDPAVLDAAVEWTDQLADQATRTPTQDLVFMIYVPFRQAYEHTGDHAYREVILQAAGTLMERRYNPTVRCITSGWGRWNYPVNIDSMMALELLLWASKNGGQSQWYDAAMSHATKVIESHIRPDGSTWQYVDFDPATGEVIERFARQGHSAQSTWARGQAWALYGFAVCYRQTNEPLFLETANRVADYFINHLPEDFVPYWDFEALNIPDAPKDASAAAIGAAGLLELSDLLGPPAGVRYRQAAERILAALMKRKSEGGYLGINARGEPTSPGLLVHACDNYHAGRKDLSTMYADYYFLESLVRLRYNRKLIKTPVGLHP